MKIFYDGIFHIKKKKKDIQRRYKELSQLSIIVVARLSSTLELFKKK